MSVAGIQEFFPTSVVKGLSDKIYERRKAAAFEVERLVKDLVQKNEMKQIGQIIELLGRDYAMSHNVNTRLGGLIAMAATATALGKESRIYVNKLIEPVLNCFHDSDRNVRYFGCEALYNIIKMTRDGFLPHFNEVFDGLSRLAADPDCQVRNGCGLLNNLVRDIVTTSSNMNLEELINQLRTRIYNRIPYTRMFIVSWVDELDNQPDIDMVLFLPQLLDGLFQILGDSHQEVKQTCKNCLKKLLKNITDGRSKSVDYHSMVNIVLLHCQSSDPSIQLMAITWLEEFVNLGGRNAILPYVSSSIVALLPCLAYDDSNRNEVRDRADKVQTAIMKMITNEDDCEYEKDNSQNDINIDTIQDETNLRFNMTSAVDALSRQMAHESVSTRIASLHWISHLQKQAPNRILSHLEKFFPLLVTALSDPDEGVIYTTIEILSNISLFRVKQNTLSVEKDFNITSEILNELENSHKLNSYFTKFMLNIINLFKSDISMLDKDKGKGMVIVRQLCIFLGAENVYKCLALIILLVEKDFNFSTAVTEMLAYILLTSAELYEVRKVLKDLKTDHSVELFQILYRAFSHNLFAIIALCLLSQMYEHSSMLVKSIADINVTVNILFQLDRLVQLIESPIFSSLRIQLLEARNYPFLVESLYGILMLLPQSLAFQTLQTRLQCIPPQNLFLSISGNKTELQENTERKKAIKSVNFDELFILFRQHQNLIDKN